MSAAGRAAASNIKSSGVSAGDLKELVGANPEKRNWKGIIIAVLVILIVFALITVAVILVSPDGIISAKDDTKLGEKFTFDDMFSKEFHPKTFEAKWIGEENVFVYRSREGEIMEYDLSNHTKKRIMDNSTFRLCDTETYFVSEDLKYVLIAHNIEKVYRHSFVAEYLIFNRFSSDATTRLIKFPQDINGSWVNKKLQYAGWSRTGHALTFVYENNLYYQEKPSTTPTKVTDSGSKTIYNGIPDWLYEEEIFHTYVSHWWSKDSTYLCYTEIDDTRVPNYTFPWYGQSSNLYGDFETLAYPKAGDQRENINPVIKLHVVNPKNMASTHRVLSPPSQFADQEYYVTKVQWQDDANVLVIWSNRAQNHSIVTICSAAFGDCRMSLEQKSTGGWVTIESVYFINQNNHYLTLLPALETGKGYWKHIHMIRTDSNPDLKTCITQGAFEVLDILGYKESTQTVYYLSTDGDPRKRHIFSVTIPNANQPLRQPKCITCDLGDHCQYVTGSFSATGEYYILNCQGPGVPQYMLKSTIDDKFTKMFEDNALLATKLKSTAIPIQRHPEIITKEGHKLFAKVLLPPILQEDHITRFPLLIHTYAGPGSQLVTYKFKLGWETYLTSSLNIIYVMIDGRGTIARGDEWLHKLYKSVGTVEVQDQIQAAEYMRDNWPYVDKERVGIWGASYGGFVTAHALGDEHSDVFNCGISVAPVTDFRYYDTAYTERYLGLGNAIENIQGYDNANVSEKAKNFKGKEFMLIHGTADDNVHFQHTAQFIKTLTQAEVDFRVQVYTDKRHALSGPQTSRHLYKTMTNFIKDSCWDGANPREFRKGEYHDVDLQLLAIR